MKILPYVYVPRWCDITHPRVLLHWGCGIFRNSDGIIPGRWGFYFFGFEFGSRNPGDRIGLFLRRIGLWPW